MLGALLQVVELYKAADKYDVPGLMSECMQILRQLTTADDVAALLQVSNMHPFAVCLHAHRALYDHNAPPLASCAARQRVLHASTQRIV